MMKSINEAYSHLAQKNYPIKILQFGEGNFLRGFVDWMINELNKESDFNAGVAVVQPIASGLIHVLSKQEGLYTLSMNGLVNGIPESRHSIINCIQKCVNPYEDYDDYLKLAQEPELRFIVSNTTEAGIDFDENDNLSSRPQNSFPGKLTAFLYKRFKIFKGAADKGLIILPCELIDRNGEKLKEIIKQYISLWRLEDSFSKWIDEHIIFTNTLVDRIVTGFPKDRINDSLDQLGYNDQLLVESEIFHLWVIEGPRWLENEFPAHKINLNVLFVDDLSQYRTRKVRLLNGAHTSMVPVSYLYGLDTVRETIDHEILGRFVKEALYEEIMPTLTLTREELEGYTYDVLERFKNPFINHYLINISLNSMSKFKTRVLPSIISHTRTFGRLPKKLVFSLASLIYFYKGDRNGTPIQLKDSQDIIELYNGLWSSCEPTKEGFKKLVASILSYEKNWGMDLNEIEGLTGAAAHYLYSIEKSGIAKAIEEVI